MKIIVLSNAVLDVPVEEAEPWNKAAKPGLVERMWDETGFATVSPSTAHRLAPTIWRTPKAAERAFSYAGATAPQTSYNILYESWGAVTARIRRPRSRTAVEVLVDTNRHPDPRAALEERLGPLAECELVRPEAETNADRPGDRDAEPEAPNRRPRRHVLRPEPAVFRMTAGENRLEAA